MVQFTKILVSILLKLLTSKFQKISYWKIPHFFTYHDLLIMGLWNRLWRTQTHTDTHTHNTHTNTTHTTQTQRTHTHTHFDRNLSTWVLHHESLGSMNKVNSFNRVCRKQVRQGDQPGPDITSSIQCLRWCKTEWAACTPCCGKEAEVKTSPKWMIPTKDIKRFIRTCWNVYKLNDQRWKYSKK